MCLAVPGRVSRRWADGDLIKGIVDFGGVTREACLNYVPDVQVGEYVIVHVGFAISKLDEREASRTLALLAALNTSDDVGWEDGA